MKAHEIMTRDVITVMPDTPIREVARIFRESGISGAPVMQDGEIIGMVTELDLIARHARPQSPLYLPLLDAKIPIPLSAQHEYREIVRRILALTAAEIMTTEVATVDAEDDVEEVATLMVEDRVNPVPVTSGGRLVGIIGRTDLIEHIEEAEEPLPPGAG